MLSLHPIFARSGTLNTGKLQRYIVFPHRSMHFLTLTRKLILCALGMSNPQRAREAYLEMSETNKQHPSSQYLIYKIALRCQNTRLGMNPTTPPFQKLICNTTATECLDSICTASTKDATLLYACVLEAQRAGDRTQSVAAMQRVLDKYDYGAPSGVHLPALLRYGSKGLL